MILVIIFMVLFYGLFGVFADIALFFNLCLMIGRFSLLGATLTLPGIAGIALTMGMAVDANVLIYERIKEELRSGRNAIFGSKPGSTGAFGRSSTATSRPSLPPPCCSTRLRSGAGVRRDAQHRHHDLGVHRLHADPADRGLVGAVEAAAERADLGAMTVIPLRSHRARHSHCRSHRGRSARAAAVAAHRPGRYAFRLHALPPDQLPDLGGAVDRRDHAVLHPWPEFRHRLPRRHAAGGAGQVRRRRHRRDALRRSMACVSAKSSCSSSAAPRTS